MAALGLRPAIVGPAEQAASLGLGLRLGCRSRLRRLRGRLWRGRRDRLWSDLALHRIDQLAVLGAPDRRAGIGAPGCCRLRRGRCLRQGGLHQGGLRHHQNDQDRSLHRVRHASLPDALNAIARSKSTRSSAHEGLSPVHGLPKRCAGNHTGSMQQMGRRRPSFGACCTKEMSARCGPRSYRNG